MYIYFLLFLVFLVIMPLVIFRKKKISMIWTLHGTSKGEHERNHILLNSDQKKTYDAVLNSIYNNLGQFFFLNGAGGTCKTFFYKTIISKLRY